MIRVVAMLKSPIQTEIDQRNTIEDYSPKLKIELEKLDSVNHSLSLELAYC